MGLVRLFPYRNGAAAASKTFPRLVLG